MDRIECTVCNKEMRKSMNKMERHWKSHHEDRLQKGEKVSQKIPSKGIINLDKYFSKTKKKKDEVEESVEIDGEEIGEDDATQLEVVEEEVVDEVKAADTGCRKRPASTSLSSDSENENPTKKDKENFVEIVKRGLADLNSKLTGIDKKVDDLKEEVRHKKEVVGRKQKTPLDKNNNKEHETKDMFESSKTIEELEDVLIKLEIVKEPDVEEGVDGFYCVVCFDSSRPNWTNKGQVTGVFRLKKAGTEDEEDTQSVPFRRLKEHIRNHLKTKTHTQKKDIQQTKIKASLLKQSREKLVGMNVFRERYLGIMQSKSRLDFEEDMLRAKLNGEDVGDQNHSDDFAKKLDFAIYSEMKAQMKEQMEAKLDATDKKRPAGFMMDKMTPSKRTGQMHGVVIPVPENPLTQVITLHF